MAHSCEVILPLGRSAPISIPRREPRITSTERLGPVPAGTFEVLAKASAFLQALPEHLQLLVGQSATAVALPVGTVLYEPGVRPRFVHFLTSGMASEVMEMGNGCTPEILTLGSEGVAEATHLLGPSRVPSRAFMKISGTGLQMSFSAFERLFAEHPALRSVVLRYVQYRIALLSQTAACNRLHGVQQRLATYLLMVQDRTRSNSFILTQEFLADMIGTQRTTITHIARSLQRLGFIEYSRGKMIIRNREGLESAACECFRATMNQVNTLYS